MTPSQDNSYTFRKNGLPILIAIAVGMFAFFWPSVDGLSAQGQRLAAVVLVMAILWVSQAIPIAVTSLIPLAAFPLLGIQPAKVVSVAYINQTIFLYLCGFIIALGIERWELHRRIALYCVFLLGSGPKRIVLGFMTATALLSMWISNTASTLLMLPIGLALVTTIEKAIHPGDDDSVLDSYADGDSPIDKLGTVLVLGIAYAASIGGVSTLVGTPTNIAYDGFWKNPENAELFPQAAETSAGEWIVVFFPLSFLFLLICWGVLTMRIGKLPGMEKLSRPFIRKQIQSLGRLSTGEWAMLFIFMTTAILWVTRQPIRFEAGGAPVLPGWGPAFEAMLIQNGMDASTAKGAVHDSTVGMLMALLMFLIPVWRSDTRRYEAMMNWETVENKVPWGIILLFGGGFAIAGAFQSTGLAAWLGERIADVLAGQPTILLVAGICLLMTFLTEFTSNVATINTLLPVLLGTAMQLEIDPRLLMIPATVSASCAFMLPIATPPNAIVYGSGKISMRQMIRAGIALNLIGVLLVVLVTFLLLIPVMGIAV